MSRGTQHHAEYLNFVLANGGYAAAGVTNETWTWNGAAWTLRDASGPAARYYHAMAFDEVRRVCVLFGAAHDGWSSGQSSQPCWLRSSPSSSGSALRGA